MSNEEIVRKELRLIIRELGLLNHNCFNSGLTLVQAHILNYLEKNGPTPFNELLIQLGIDKASLSRTLNNLQNKIYIKMEKLQNDKRMKVVSLLPLGTDAIRSGDCAANSFIGDILNLASEEHINNIAKSLKEFRILALRNNFIKSHDRIIIEKSQSNYVEEVIKLAAEVFNGEQNIPEKLVPIKEEMVPIWWHARVDGDIIGACAAWKENNEWHWGRFCIDRRLRGMGIGSKIAKVSLNELFKLGASEIFIEARPITLKLLEKFGCEITGKPIDFYGDSVTPVIMKRYNFINSLKQVGELENLIQ